MQENHDEEAAGEGRGSGPEKIPALEPGRAAWGCLRRGMLDLRCLLRQKDDLPAIGAVRQMSEGD
jgi:hypothetical protein